MMWIKHFKKVKENANFPELITNHKWPDIKKEHIDFDILNQIFYLKKFKDKIRMRYKKAS